MLLSVDLERQDIDEIEDTGDVEPFYKNDGYMVMNHLNITSVLVETGQRSLE